MMSEEGVELDVCCVASILVPVSTVIWYLLRFLLCSLVRRYSCLTQSSVRAKSIELRC